MPRIKYSEMYIDYAMCMSQKEMERKYNIAYSTIARRCKKITEMLFDSDHGILYKQVDVIREEVDKIIEKDIKTRVDRAKEFWD